MGLAAGGKRFLCLNWRGYKRRPDFQGILLGQKFGKLLAEVLEFGQSRMGCCLSVEKGSIILMISLNGKNMTRAESPLMKRIVHTISVTLLSCDIICRSEASFLRLVS